MPTTRTKTVKPNGGGDYLTLAAAIAGEKVAVPNLVTSDVVLDIVCYPGTDTGGVVTVDTFTTDATRYVSIRMAVRHQGVFTDDGTYYLLDIANNNVIVAKVNFLRVDGLMFRASITGSATAALFMSSAFPAGAFDVRFTNCYCKAILTAATAGYNGFMNSNIDDANGKIYLINNCFEGFHNIGADTSDCFAVELRSAPTLQQVYMYNNAAIRCASGFRPRAYAHMKNNLAVSCWSGFRTSAANNDSVTNGSTDKKSPTPLSAFNLMGLPVLLRNPPSGDFRLSPSDQFMIGAATDLSADANYPFSTDIAGNTRPVGGWALGPWQPIDAPTQGVRWLRAGAVTPTGAQVKAKMLLPEPGVNVNLWVSQFSDLRNPTIFSSAAPAPGNVATFNLSGLIASTIYYYGVTVAGGTVPYTKQGKFTTAPKVGPASFVFVAAGDSDTGSSEAAFLNIRDSGALFFMHLGDTHYDDVTTSDASKQRRAHDNRFQSINQAALYTAMACNEVWDDHDWGGGNSNRTSAAGPGAASAWREMIPHYTFPEPTSIYHSFVIGRCRFIVTDQRSAADPNNSANAATNTMLGASQLAWFKNELLLAKNAGQLIFWACPRPWLGTDAAADGGDHWAGFSGERKVISDFCQTNGIVNLVRLSADVHRLAVDDGTNDKYTTDTLGNSFVTVQLAPLHQNDPGTDVGTGPWSGGSFAVPGGTTIEQQGGYGLVTVTDDGVNTIQVNIKGFYGTAQQFTITKTYNVPGPVGGGALHGSSWAAIGTVGAPASKLYAYSGGILVDISPGSGLANGNIDGKFVAGNYGDGFYGLGAFGVGNGKAQFNDAATWHLDNFGEWLIASCTSDGKLWYWNRDPSTQARLIDGAPTSCGGGIVVTPERFLFALGADQVVRRVKWPSQESLTDWAASEINSAGTFDLQTRGQLVCGRAGRNETFLFTDVDMWVARFIGGDFIYQFEQKGEGCGIIGPHAVAVVGDNVYWMSHGRFFMYDGVVKPLSCDVADYVFNDLNLTQRAKITTVVLAQFDEVWWYYPSQSQNGLEPDRYVVYNWRENHWSIGNLNRCAGVDKGVFEGPLLVDSLGGLYLHESGNDRVGAVFAESGPFEIDAGNEVVQVQRIVPDEQTLGDLVVSFYLSMYPTDTETTVGPYSASQPTNVRFTARNARMRVDQLRSTGWRMGIFRLGVVPGGRR